MADRPETDRRAPVGRAADDAEFDPASAKALRSKLAAGRSKSERAGRVAPQRIAVSRREAPQPEAPASRQWSLAPLLGALATTVAEAAAAVRSTGRKAAQLAAGTTAMAGPAVSGVVGLARRQVVRLKAVKRPAWRLARPRLPVRELSAALGVGLVIVGAFAGFEWWSDARTRQVAVNEQAAPKGPPPRTYAMTVTPTPAPRASPVETAVVPKAVESAPAASRPRVPAPSRPPRPPATVSELAVVARPQPPQAISPPPEPSLPKVAALEPAPAQPLQRARPLLVRRQSSAEALGVAASPGARVESRGVDALRSLDPERMAASVDGRLARPGP